MCRDVSVIEWMIHSLQLERTHFSNTRSWNSFETTVHQNPPGGAAQFVHSNHRWKCEAESGSFWVDALIG